LYIFSFFVVVITSHYNTIAQTILTLFFYTIIRVQLFLKKNK